MANKLILLAVLALLCAGSAAAATQTFSGWLKNGESITTERESFLIQIDSVGNKVWADYGTGALHIQNNSCDQTRTAKVCVDNIEYLLPDRRYRASLNVYALAPKITVEREFANKELIIGNDTVVTVTIENDGDVTAASVKYTDPLSQDIAVEELSGAAQESGRVVWSGAIKAGESKEITYRIRPKESMDRKFAATVSYYDGFETKTISSSDVSLKVTPFVTLTSKIPGRTDLFAGEVFNYTVNITNLDTRQVHFDFFQVKTDKGIEITEKPYELKKADETTYRYESWTLSQNRSKVFRLKAKGKLVSESNMYASAGYSGFDKVSRSIGEQKSSVRITEKGVAIKTSLGEQILEENQEKKLIISVSNNNPAISLKDVFVAASSSLAYIPNGYYPALEASKTERIEKTFTAPHVEAQQGYTISVSVTYNTEFGDSGSKTITDTVSVIPIKDLTVSQTLDKTEMEGGEQAIVKVKVENPRLVKVNNVRIRSTISEQLIVSGAASNTVNIYSKETIDGLVYFVTAPKTGKTETFNITTEVWYEDGGKKYEYKAANALTVKPKDLKLTVTKSVAESDIYEGEPFQVTYSIRNPSVEEAAENVRISFPLQQEFDLIGGKREHIIPAIGPGELVYVYGEEMVRGKYNTSLSLLKTTVSYQNEEGARFTANTSEVAIKVQTAYKKGPYIILEKKAPDKANNLDGFNVSVKAKNTGNEQGTAHIQDGQQAWSVLLDAGAEKEFTYATRLPNAGINDLPRAIAAYSHGNRTFTTASNAGKITIEHKPVIALERSIPAEGNTIDNVNITLKATNILGKKISNLTIIDNGNEWVFDGLDSKKQVWHIINFTSPGRQGLGKATASYIFEGDRYEVETEEGSIAITDKKLLTLEKSAPETSLENENFTVTITAIALGYPLENVLIRDGEKEWNLSIKADSGEKISYQKNMGESGPLEAASATFSYNGREFNEYSSQLNIEIKKDAKKPQPEETAGKKKGGPLSGVISFLKGIVTWKRK